MICESCGSRIPDGSKFCTECGTKIAAPAGEVPDVILPDIPNVILPDIPDIPDVILPDTPVIPDISRGILHDEEPAPAESPEEPVWSTVSQTPIVQARPAPEEPPAESMWSTVSQMPAAAERPAPAPGALYAATPDAGSGPSIGYSTVSGYTYVPPEVPDAARTPLYKRWWFWLILGLGAAAFVVLLVALLIVYSVRNTMPPTDDLPPEIGSILSQAEALDDIDDIPDFLENAFDLPDGEDDAFPLDSDDKYVPMDVLTAEIDRVLTEMDLGHEVSVDEDGWVFVDVWTDGLDGLAEAAYEGDEASLADWNALTENIRLMSEDFLSDLQEGGQHSAVCVVSLLDDVDPSLSLAIAIDGELILDLVAGLDEYGLMEE